MTYLEIVNKVLIRLREEEVTSVADTSYSKLIGEFVNQIKREVEDSWRWVALRDTLQATTLVGEYRYRLTGVKERFTLRSVINQDTGDALKMKNSHAMTKLHISNKAEGNPMYFDISGVDSATGDYFLDLYPIPNSVQTININIERGQGDLINNNEETKAPSMPILLGAYYLAITERGEDGGLMAAESYRHYQSSLADSISMESTHVSKGTNDWNVN